MAGHVVDLFSDFFGNLSSVAVVLSSHLHQQWIFFSTNWLVFMIYSFQFFVGVFLFVVVVICCLLEWYPFSLWLALTFPFWLLSLSIFSCICWPFVFCLLKNVHSHSWPVYNKWFGCCWVSWPPCVTWILILIRYILCKYFHPFCQFVHFAEFFLCCTEAS